MTTDARFEGLRAEALRSLAAARADDLNGFTQVAEEAAVERELAAALRGGAAGDAEPLGEAALRGRAIAIKDNIHVAGLRNTAATPALAEFEPDADAPAVERLRRRGMVVIGKTNMHELALGVTGSHTATGPVVNAVDRALVTGGSSAGSAVVVASGVCELSLGSDTGGSTRIPAAFNDIWGFRPSTGRYDEEGGTSIAFSRDTIGPMTASLEGIVALDSALARTADAAVADVPVARIGYDPADIELCDAPVAEAFHAALEAVAASNGCELVEAPLDRLNRVAQSFDPELAAQELAPSLRSYLGSSERLPSLERVVEELVDPHVVHMIEGSLAATSGGVWSGTWHRLMNEMARLRTAYQRMLGEAGLVATMRPTTPLLPRPLAEVLGMSLPERNALFGRTIHFSSFATLMGAPSLSLPLGPLLGHSMTGVLLEALPGLDVELLSLGRRVEAALRG